MNTVRLGIFGMGAMGREHAANLLAGKVSGGELVAVCDVVPANLAPWPGIRSFATTAELFAARCVDGVVIATPHFAHEATGLAALAAGLHVLIEKPVTVDVGAARRLSAAAAARPGQVAAVMLNQRTDPYYGTVRRLVRTGELGAIHRIQWTITNWFRPAAYFRANDWRATWAGEGGGVLVNQCPHQLDLWQWIFGQPRRVTAFCGFGRYHAIEVEDDVTAYLEYANGTHGTFIASTGEAPGTNRLEIAAEMGRLVCEDDQLSWRRNKIPTTEFSRTTTERFASPPSELVSIPISGHGGQHVEILQNFVEAIQGGARPVAPILDGVNSVELANAMLLSAWRRGPVDLPLDAVEYENELRARIDTPKRPDPDNDWGISCCE